MLQLPSLPQPALPRKIPSRTTTPVSSITPIMNATKENQSRKNMSQIHNENSRVKIPAILHLMRLGYDYLSLKNENWDKPTNIFPEIFIESLCRINPDLSPDDAHRLLTDISIELDNEDLGQDFYERLTNQSGGKKLIDFQNFNNNSFHVVTELPCINGDEEFRPDITLAAKKA